MNIYYVQLHPRAIVVASDENEAREVVLKHISLVAEYPETKIYIFPVTNATELTVREMRRVPLGATDNKTTGRLLSEADNEA